MKVDNNDNYIIGIDVGTSVIKTALYAVNGNLIGLTNRKNIVLRKNHQFAECDMNDIWSKVLQCLKELVETFPAYIARTRTIGITAQGDGTWLIDKENQPVGNAITWLDGRTSSLVKDYHESGVAQEVFNITGTDINSSNQGAQLRWLKMHSPASLRKAKKAIRAKDWIYLKLTGVVSTDISDASFTYMNFRTGKYDDAVLSLMEIDDLVHLLPEAVPLDENNAPIIASVASEIGLSPQTIISCGPIDVSASALGVGVYHDQEAATVFGTAAIHQVVCKDPPQPPIGVGYTISHGIDGSFLRLLPSKTGTLNSQWFVEQIYGSRAHMKNGKLDWQRIEEEISDIPVGSNGILYHPFIDPSGERVPFNSHTARAQFTGIHLNHDLPTMLHAVFEGVVLSALDCYKNLSVTPKEIRLTGGGSNSIFWSQMFCDALGIPVTHVHEKETGCKGAMISASVTQGYYTSFSACIEKVVYPSKTLYPDMKKHKDYAELFEIYRKTYTSMFPIWDRLYEYVAKRH